MRKYWDTFVAYISSIPYDKLLHFIGGTYASLFVLCILNMPFCCWGAIVAGYIKDYVFDKRTTGVVDSRDFLWTCIGGLLVQIFAVL